MSNVCIVCKNCGQTKGHHSSANLRCPIAPPYPESDQIPGIVDRFSKDDRWRATTMTTTPLPERTAK